MRARPLHAYATARKRPVATSEVGPFLCDDTGVANVATPHAHRANHSRKRASFRRQRMTISVAKPGREVAGVMLRLPLKNRDGFADGGGNSALTPLA